MTLRAFLILLFSALLTSVLAAETAKIIRMTGAQAGTVYLPDNTEVPASVGLEVPVGALIEVGEGTKLFLKTFEGQITVAEAGSVFEIEAMEVTAENKEMTRINLKNGDLVANLDPTKRSTNDYGVRTPKGVAAARGTNYSVSVNGFTVLVMVSNGQVSFSVPELGPDPISLNPGQASSGNSGNADTLAGALANPATAAIARAALRATAAAVATLASVEGSGVSVQTLSDVITTAGEASDANGDSGVIAEIAAAAAAANPSTAEAVVTAAVRASPNSAASVVTSVTDSVTQATAPTTTTTTTSGTTTTTTTTTAKPTAASIQSTAERLALIANTAATSVNSTVSVNPNSITQTVQTTQASRPVATTVTTSTNNTAPAPTGTTTTTTSAQNQTTTTSTTETPVIQEVPIDNTVVTRFSTFTIRLSGGRLVAVTLNDRDERATVRLVTAVEGTQTTQVGDGAATAFSIPSEVTAVIGTVSVAQFNNIADSIRAVLPGPTVTVPNNTITVSPSS